MASNDVQSLRNQKSSYENQKREYETRYENNSKKIKRLRAAKKKLGQVKARLEQHSKMQKKTASNGYTYGEWLGDVRNSVCELLSETVPEEYSYYIKAVDNVLDAIVDEETTLENENTEIFGIIGKLAGLINSLAAEIEKLWN